MPTTKQNLAKRFIVTNVPTIKTIYGLSTVEYYIAVFNVTQQFASLINNSDKIIASTFLHNVFANYNSNVLQISNEVSSDVAVVIDNMIKVSDVEIKNNLNYLFIKLIHEIVEIEILKLTNQSDFDTRYSNYTTFYDTFYRIEFQQLFNMIENMLEITDDSVSVSVSVSK